MLCIFAIALTLSVSSFAQVPASATAPSTATVPVTSTQASGTPAVVAVTPAEAQKIAADVAAYQVAGKAEQAPKTALEATPAQQALHTSTISAMDQTNADVAATAAAHGVDLRQMQYVPAQGGFVRGHATPNRPVPLAH